MSKKPQIPKRRRGVILSAWGLQRLQDAQEQLEETTNYGDRFTLEQLSQLTGISARSIRKIRHGQESVDRQTLLDLFAAFKLTLSVEDYAQPESTELEEFSPITTVEQDWGEATDVSVFFGREEEQFNLKQWVLQDNCRLIAILGIGGIGKTSLAVKLAEHIQNQFTYVIWRSLRNAPPLATLLKEIIPFLSEQEYTQGDISRFLQCLRKNRCLVILDNLETILQAGDRVGEFRPGYEDYGDLLRIVGESYHQSCVLLTSREKPSEIASFEGIGLSVRSLQLRGSPEASLGLAEATGIEGTEPEKLELSDRYGANPLALKIVSTSIRDLFDGSISAFLEQDTLVFNGLRRLLDQQFNRLSALEQSIMYELAINREWMTIPELLEDILPTVQRAHLLEAVESLSWRSLVERKSTSYTQQPVVMEYATKQLIDQVVQELIDLDFHVYERHSLLKTTVPDYIRDSQIRLILQAIAEALSAHFGPSNVAAHLQLVLQAARKTQTPFFGCAVGNTINLYQQLQLDLTGLDFSHCKIRHADLAGVTLQQTNFTGSSFQQSIFSQPCNEIYAVAYSPNGQLFATGEADSQIRIWHTADSQLLLTMSGHTNAIRSLRFCPDGNLLASASADQTIRLWSINSGQCLAVFSGHRHSVLAIAWSPDGQTLASGSADHTLRLWDVQSGDCRLTIPAHENWVYTVDWSPDGQTLASGSADQTVRLWSTKTGSLLQSWSDHTGYVTAVQFSPDGQRLASSSTDHTIRLWDLESAALINILRGSQERVTCIDFSPDGETLASGGADQIIRLWDVETGYILKSLSSHTSVVFAVRFSPDGKFLVSGGEDHTVMLWNVSTGQSIRALRGITGWLYAAQFSPDGRLLASGGDEPVIRLWDVQTQHPVATLPGHELWVRAVQFSPDGQLLASASADQTIQLWHLATQRLHKVLHGHTEEVRSICFSPDGQLLASASQDQTVRLWEVETGNLCSVLPEHTGWVRSVHFSPDGHYLASGGDDHTVKVWQVETGCERLTLHGHTNCVRSVQFSPDGRLLASGSDDQTICLWEVETGKLIRVLRGETNWTRSLCFNHDGTLLVSGGMDRTLRLWHVATGKELGKFLGHTLGVLSVTFSPDDQLIVSCSADETIRFWHPQTQDCLRVLRSDRPCEGMNITGVTGITAAQQATLKTLGAIVK
jgi:WD40 repeat protein/transcriptional regulator with XRE-family HTH domain